MSDCIFFNGFIPSCCILYNTHRALWTSQMHYNWLCCLEQPVTNLLRSLWLILFCPLCLPNCHASLIHSVSVFSSHHQVCIHLQSLPESLQVPILLFWISHEYFLHVIFPYIFRSPVLQQPSALHPAPWSTLRTASQPSFLHQFLSSIQHFYSHTLRFRWLCCSHVLSVLYHARSVLFLLLQVLSFFRKCCLF